MLFFDSVLLDTVLLKTNLSNSIQSCDTLTNVFGYSKDAFPDLI